MSCERCGEPSVWTVSIPSKGAKHAFCKACHDHWNLRNHEAYIYGFRQPCEGERGLTAVCTWGGLFTRQMVREEVCRLLRKHMHPRETKAPHEGACSP